jgi:hypothetical protein
VIYGIVKFCPDRRGKGALFKIVCFHTFLKEIVSFVGFLDKKKVLTPKAGLTIRQTRQSA